MRWPAWLVVGLLAVRAASAAPGDLDPTFGTGGTVMLPLGESHAFASALVLQPDGKLVSGGQAVVDGRTDMALVRLLADGTPDPTFGTNGRVLTPVGASDAIVLALALQPDGKIVGAGHSGAGGDIALARWNPDGSLDQTFGVGGTVTTDIGPGMHEAAYALVLQSDGKIVAAGYTSDSDNSRYWFALARYGAGGTLDPTFGTGGIVTTVVGGAVSLAYGIVQQADAKLVAAGWWNDANAAGLGLARYDADGLLDATFGSGGIVTAPSPFAEALLLVPDGKLIVAGNTSGTCCPDFALARYLSDGSLDATFGTNGQTTTDITTFDQAEAAARQSDGKLVLAGSGHAAPGTAVVLARYDADGHLDPAFGNGGSIMTSVGSYDAHPRTVVTQPDQKIVTAGYAYGGDGIARFMLVRHLGVGPCDDTPCTTTTTSTAATTSTTSTTLACAVDATKARLVAARLAPPSGDDTLKLTGVATIPTTRIVDPATDGLRLLYGGPTSVVVDVTVPPGRYDPASGRGWSARSGTFRYVDHTASGVRKVLVKAMDPASGTYKVQLAGKNADYAVAADDLPLHAIVVLDPPVAASGQCATWRFPASPPARPSCTRNAGGTAVRCR